MSTAPTETSPPGPVVSLENLLFNFPEADIILRSRDSHEFRVLRIYIVHSSPILGEKVLLSSNPQSDPIPAESNVEGTVANAPCVVQLPVEGAILFSLLTYIFPVPTVLPSTVEQIMELLSVAQMYKMDDILTHIRSHIAQQEPPFIREATALLIYSLAQKHNLRTETLDAARCTLSFLRLTIEDLAEEGKLDMMSGAFLHELWNYHERVRSNLKSDIEEFRKSNAVTILGNLSCDLLTNSALPCWLDNYISDIGTGRVPAFLDLTDFHMGLAEHIQNRSSNGGCKSCSGIPRRNIRAFWEALTAVVHGSITKVRVVYVSAFPKGPEHLYRLRRSFLRVRNLMVRPDRLAKPALRQSIQICLMQMLSSGHPTVSISVSINRCWLHHRPFLGTCSLSPNHQMMQRLTSFPW
jgi:hypothetical protein